MPNIGRVPRRVWTVLTTEVRRCGSPGPGERKIPSGFQLRTSSAVALHGSTMGRQPAFQNRRRILNLSPQSSTTNRGLPDGSGSSADSLPSGPHL